MLEKSQRMPPLFDLSGGLFSYLQQNDYSEHCLQAEQPKTAVITSQEFRDQLQEPTTILVYGTKREIWSCWLSLFLRWWKGFTPVSGVTGTVKGLLSMMYACLQVFRDTDLKGYPMSLSHTRPLAGQSSHSKLTKFASWTGTNSHTVGWFLSPWIRDLMLRQSLW